MLVAKLAARARVKERFMVKRLKVTVGIYSSRGQLDLWSKKFLRSP